MSSKASIAVLSMACRFPDASTPEALWDNVLDGRRSFRSIPPERLPLRDYALEAVGEADCVTPVLAGLLTDWTFDRTRFRVSQAGYASADLAHWLALEIASEAIERIGGASALSRERTAVIVGNTLTGEFSRAGQMRHRLPYLGERLGEVLAARGVAPGEARDLVAAFRDKVCADFPQPDEESLAGGLANTIAGRIANHFDLKGGAWTVDGACASSLLAIGDACTRLADGSIDLAIVGGVDLSLDPFELVGFSRNGALARDQMRVFDRRAAGFWPGEGCGFVTLARAETGLGRRAEPLAFIEGWGVSTDGAGGLTRPTEAGQLAALRRAYGRAGIDPGRLGYVEAHGTGTAIGDPTEIAALAALCGERTRPVPIGSIKGNIGHAKAAAGVAGVIKTVLALQAATVPPHVGCDEPHPAFAANGWRVAPSLDAAAWRGEGDRIAGVSGFGFGGVNAHIVLRGPREAASRPVPLSPPPQDTEAFVFAERTPEALLARLQEMRGAARHLSLSGMADAARHAAATCEAGSAHRAAVTAAKPAELAERLDRAIAAVRAWQTLEFSHGVGVQRSTRPPRIGLLFPGQAAPVRPDGGVWRRRFAESRTVLGDVPSDGPSGAVATEIAQPAIAAASAAGIAVLARLGLTGDIAIGHSLGELSALHWAGALSATALVELAAARGALMAARAESGGAMARVALDLVGAAREAAADGLVVACENATTETVVAGPSEAVDRFIARQRRRGVEAERLAVSHAFHSPAMAPAAGAFADVLAGMRLRPLERAVISTVSGAEISSQEDVRALLVRQFVAPVRFTSALSLMAEQCDLLVEVGPGAGLTRLAGRAGHLAVSIDAHGPSLQGLCESLAVAWLAGARLDLAPLFDDRRLRPFDPAERPTFLASPCGRQGPDDALPSTAPSRPEALPVRGPTPAVPGRKTLAVPAPAHEDAPTLVGQLLDHVAAELALPRASLTPDLRFLDDLHLNSLAVGRIVAGAAARLGMQPPVLVSDFANATIAELADHLTEMKSLGGGEPLERDRLEGVAPWIASYRFAWKEAAPPRHGTRCAWCVVEPEGDAARDRPDGATPGALVVIEDWRAEGGLERLWRATHSALRSGFRHIAFVHRDAPVSGFARSLHREALFDSVAVVELAGPGFDPATALDILSRVDTGYAEWRREADGSTARAVFRRLADDERDRPFIPWNARDVLVVSGGARGIGAECALRLAERTGARLILIGRSPDGHPDVRATLDRAAALGLACVYASADIRDAAAVAQAIAAGEAQLGPVTGILHAAGINRPARFQEIDETEFRDTIGVKLDGLEALLKAVDVGRLKAVVGFGSIIGRLGLAGETHYALANAAQSARLSDCARDNPSVRVLALEWSVWASVGMGERLGTVERLADAGVQALPLDEALAVFERLVVDGEGEAGARVLTGRFPAQGDVDLDPPDLPMLRFLENVRLHYPGLEIVADASLSLGSDPYLADHVIDGEVIMPGVMLLEAMAQAADGLMIDAPGRTLEEIRFDRPVALPEHGAVTLRIAALRQETDTVRCVVRASDDGFASIRATARIRPSSARRLKPIPLARPTHEPVDAGPLYGRLFFNGGLFRRVASYSRLSAFEMSAGLRAGEGGSWFGAFLPQQLRLGDPASRDAGLHALQACVPQRRVVPVAVDRIAIVDPLVPRASVEARQVSATSKEFVFDILFRSAAGKAVERWQGARFRSLAVLPTEPLPEALFVPWFEREIALATGRSDIRVARAMAMERGDRRRLAAIALGAGDILHRGDGKPVTTADAPLRQVSVTHAGDETLMILAGSRVGCDLEPDTGASIGRASTEFWCAGEALRKCGVSSLGLDVVFNGPSSPAGRSVLFAGYDLLTRLWRGRWVAVALARPEAHSGVPAKGRYPADRRRANGPAEKSMGETP